jgi:chemotaxis signal transduction protein
MNDETIEAGEQPNPPGLSVDGIRDRRSIPLMLLRLGTRWFAMDVRSIEEVALKGAVTRVPAAPRHILGVTSLRGRLVTVMSLEQMMGGAGVLQGESSATLPRLVVVRDGDYEMAVVAEGIHGMTEHFVDNDGAIEPPTGQPAFVREVFDWEGNHVALLDVSALIATAAQMSGISSPTEQVDS